MRVHRIMTMGAALLFSTAVGAFAGQATQTPPSPQSPASTGTKTTTHKASSTSTSKTHQATGTVVSVSDSSLVLDQKVNGKTRQETYTLNSSTKRSGNLETGAHVTVHYQKEDNAMVATSVTAHAAKATSSTSKPKPSTTKPGSSSKPSR